MQVLIVEINGSICIAKMKTFNFIGKAEIKESQGSLEFKGNLRSLFVIKS